MSLGASEEELLLDAPYPRSSGAADEVVVSAPYAKSAGALVVVGFADVLLL